MRNIFIEQLIVAAKKNKKIILVVNDLGYSVVEKFAKLYPKQFYNAGVAEQNLMGIAAGLALEGHKVFVYSIGNFPTFRCAEQIRNDIDYHNLPVTIVNVGSGLGYGMLGYSHHSIQDYSLMRSFPNMTIVSPIDILETKICMNYILKTKKPFYLRLSKTKLLNNRIEKNKIFAGKWNRIKKKSNNRTFLITGNILNYAVKLLSTKKYKNHSLYSLPIWGMKFKDKQKNQLKKWKEIIVLEDHLEDGGFGSWVKESINNTNINTKIISKYLNKNVVGKVGTESYLLKKFFGK